MRLEPSTIYLPSAVADAAERSATVRNPIGTSTDGKNGMRAADEDNFLTIEHSHVGDMCDEDLLKQACDGSREALSLLFRRHALSVRNVAQRILRNEAEADDVVQEVFLYIFRKAALFDPAQSSGRSWIIQVAYHRAFDRRRYLIRRRFYDCLGLDAPAAAALRSEIAFYESSLEGVLGAEALAKIKEALSPDQRKTLNLYFFAGYSVAEIAEKMQQSTGNVRHHYHRGLERIRKLLFPSPPVSK
jgi:RNA polymerase sigma-70 factor, ECF subfamily